LLRELQNIREFGSTNYKVQLSATRIVLKWNLYDIEQETVAVTSVITQN